MLNSFGPLYRKIQLQQSADQLIFPNSNALAHTHRINAHSTSLSLSHPGTMLTHHLVTPHLALLALLPTTVYEIRRGLVEWNLVWFREGVREI
ncbi:hypothetical protein DFH29DRAFT_1009416 [Suillus ampliporus]|nr:hypothetical protein DFH29DRAFT_1009416 [Suillus ampliporus]